MANQTRRGQALTIVLAAVLGVAQPLGASDASPDDPGPPLHVFMNGEAAMMLRLAISGAIKRLATPTCQQVFDDFADPEGRPLSAKLRGTGRSADALLRELYYVEADTPNQCRSLGNTTLFTEPGGRVIHVCGTRFVTLGRNSNRAEILLIHELLHALGLGENPPSSRTITDTVVRRCH